MKPTAACGAAAWGAGHGSYALCERRLSNSCASDGRARRAGSAATPHPARLRGAAPRGRSKTEHSRHSLQGGRVCGKPAGEGRRLAPCGAGASSSAAAARMPCVYVWRSMSQLRVSLHWVHACALPRHTTRLSVPRTAFMHAQRARKPCSMHESRQPVRADPHVLTPPLPCAPLCDRSTQQVSDAARPAVSRARLPGARAQQPPVASSALVRVTCGRGRGAGCADGLARTRGGASRCSRAAADGGCAPAPGCEGGNWRGSCVGSARWPSTGFGWQATRGVRCVLSSDCVS